MDQEAQIVRCRHVTRAADEVPVNVRLFGPFTVSLSGNSAGPWPRPSARRLCELLMLQPDRGLGKEVVREILFPNLALEASANALRKAVSMARQALWPLGAIGPRLLKTDGDRICVPVDIPLTIDVVTHEAELRHALALAPGGARDAALSEVLRQDAVLLADEPYSDWAIERRDAIGRLRQRARIELARDRAEGHGRSGPGAVIDAWESCLEHDPACEQAAIALITGYAHWGQRQLSVTTYRRCCKALDELGLRPSLAIEKAYRWAADCVA
jgi:DNA-binding SARP family transcriptional activator